MGCGGDLVVQNGEQQANGVLCLRGATMQAISYQRTENPKEKMSDWGF